MDDFVDGWVVAVFGWGVSLYVDGDAGDLVDSFLVACGGLLFCVVASGVSVGFVFV